MANRECNGDFFDATVHDANKQFYRCFANGQLMDRNGMNNEDECPECHRKIDARFHGTVSTRQLIVADIELFKGCKTMIVLAST